MTIAALLFIVVGTFFFFTGVVGLLRFPDFFSRMHATGKGDTLGTIFFLAGLALLYMMALGKKKNMTQPEVLESSFLFVLIPLFSPLSWTYNYLYPILAVVILMNWIGKFPSAMKYILIVNFICIGASLREFLGKGAFRFYTQHSLVVVSFLIILFYLFYIRLRMESKQKEAKL